MPTAATKTYTVVYDVTAVTPAVEQIAKIIDPFQKLATELDKVKASIEGITKPLQEFKNVMDGLRSIKIEINPQKFNNSLKAMERSAKSVAQNIRTTLQSAMTATDKAFAAQLAKSGTLVNPDKTLTTKWDEKKIEKAEKAYLKALSSLKKGGSIKDTSGIDQLSKLLDEQYRVTKDGIRSNVIQKKNGKYVPLVGDTPEKIEDTIKQWVNARKSEVKAVKEQEERFNKGLKSAGDRAGGLISTLLGTTPKELDEFGNIGEKIKAQSGKITGAINAAALEIESAIAKYNSALTLLGMGGAPKTAPVTTPPPKEEWLKKTYTRTLKPQKIPNPFIGGRGKLLQESFGKAVIQRQLQDYLAYSQKTYDPQSGAKQRQLVAQNYRGLINNLKIANDMVGGHVLVQTASNAGIPYTIESVQQLIDLVNSTSSHIVPPSKKISKKVKIKRTPPKAIVPPVKSNATSQQSYSEQSISQFAAGLQEQLKAVTLQIKVTPVLGDMSELKKKLKGDIKIKAEIVPDLTKVQDALSKLPKPTITANIVVDPTSLSKIGSQLMANGKNGQAKPLVEIPVKLAVPTNASISALLKAIKGNPALQKPISIKLAIAKNSGIVSQINAEIAKIKGKSATIKLTLDTKQSESAITSAIARLSKIAGKTPIALRTEMSTKGFAQSARKALADLKKAIGGKQAKFSLQLPRGLKKQIDSLNNVGRAFRRLPKPGVYNYEIVLSMKGVTKTAIANLSQLATLMKNMPQSRAVGYNVASNVNKEAVRNAKALQQLTGGTLQRQQGKSSIGRNVPVDRNRTMITPINRMSGNKFGRRSGKLVDFLAGETSFGRRTPVAVDMLKGMGMMVAVGEVMSTITESFNQAVDYQNTMETAKAILKNSYMGSNFNGEFRDMQTTVRDVAKQTKFTAPQAADATRFMAMAGMQIPMIKSAIRPIADVAVIGDTDLGTTADKLTNIMSSFNMVPQETRHMADAIVNTFTRTNVDMMQIAEAMEQVGGFASATGLSIDDTLAMVGLLGNFGIQGGKAGTALRSMIRTIVRPNRMFKQEEYFNKFGIERKNTDDTTKNALEILQQIAERFPNSTERDEFGRVIPNKRLSEAIAKMFGAEAIGAVIALVSNKEKLDALIKSNKRSSGLSSSISEEKQNTVQGLWHQVTSAFTDSTVTEFEGMQGEIKNILKAIRDYMLSDDFRKILHDLFELGKFAMEMFGKILKVWKTVYSIAPNLIKGIMQFQMMMTYFGYLIGPLAGITRLLKMTGGALGISGGVAAGGAVAASAGRGAMVGNALLAGSMAYPMMATNNQSMERGTVIGGWRTGLMNVSYDKYGYGAEMAKNKSIVKRYSRIPGIYHPYAPAYKDMANKQLMWLTGSQAAMMMYPHGHLMKSVPYYRKAALRMNRPFIGIRSTDIKHLERQLLAARATAIRNEAIMTATGAAPFSPKMYRENIIAENKYLRAQKVASGIEKRLAKARVLRSAEIERVRALRRPYQYGNTALMKRMVSSGKMGFWSATAKIANAGMTGMMAKSFFGSEFMTTIKGWGLSIMSGLGKTIGFLVNPATLATAAIGGLVWAIWDYNQKIKEQTEAMRNAAKVSKEAFEERRYNIENAISPFRDVDISNSELVKNAVLSEVWKSSGYSNRDLSNDKYLKLFRDTIFGKNELTDTGEFAQKMYDTYISGIYQNMYTNKLSNETSIPFLKNLRESGLLSNVYGNYDYWANNIGINPHTQVKSGSPHKSPEAYYVSGADADPGFNTLRRRIKKEATKAIITNLSISSDKMVSELIPKAKETLTSGLNFKEAAEKIRTEIIAPLKLLRSSIIAQDPITNALTEAEWGKMLAGTSRKRLDPQVFETISGTTSVIDFFEYMISNSTKWEEYLNVTQSQFSSSTEKWLLSINQIAHTMSVTARDANGAVVSINPIINSMGEIDFSSTIEVLKAFGAKINNDIWSHINASNQIYNTLKNNVELSKKMLGGISPGTFWFMNNKYKPGQKITDADYTLVRAYLTSEKGVDWIGAGQLMETEVNGVKLKDNLDVLNSAGVWAAEMSYKINHPKPPKINPIVPNPYTGSMNLQNTNKDKDEDKDKKKGNPKPKPNPNPNKGFESSYGGNAIKPTSITINIENLARFSDTKILSGNESEIVRSMEDQIAQAVALMWTQASAQISAQAANGDMV